MNPQCQACANSGVEVFEICTRCGWQNDDTLESGEAQDGSGPLVEVGYVLTSEQRTWGSWANHESVASHLARHLYKTVAPSVFRP